MFERLSDQQKFAIIPGFSHPELPYDEIELPDGQSVQKVRYCPTCLNHDFDETAEYCSICGQPLFSKCDDCGSYLKINECFCPKCGSESPFHKYYNKAEIRLQKIKDCTKQVSYSPDWLEYPYWGYTCMRLNGKRSAASENLKSALLYSTAYIDDNDNFIVFADSVRAASIIHENKSVIMDFVSQADSVEYKTLEVYVTYDI